MSSEKLTTIFGCAGVVEGSYGAGGSPVLSTDGILLTSPQTLSRGFVNAGGRAAAPSGGGVLQRQAPSGPTATVPLPVEFRGAGAAYAAGVYSDIHNLLRISGHSATLDSTPAAESWEYAPQSWDGTVPPNLASGYFDLYGRGEKTPLRGAYASMNLAIEDGGVGVFTFDVSGIPGDTTQVTLPAITYNEEVPPKGDDLTFQVGTYTGGKVRSVEFAQNREVVERSVHGWAAGRRAPTLTVTWEHPALATALPWHTASLFHAEKLRDLATGLSVSFTLGSVQYHRLSFAAAQAVIVDVQYSDDGPIALQTVTFELAQSDSQTPDDYTITTD